LGCQKEDISRMRETRVGSRELARLRKRVGALKKRCLGRYVDDKKV